ncbi:hypothetical protein ACFVHB_14890 [Kitasatospora sp. NPDC127111]|uniref:hypothetical protein n=1 Tax=Kitasatospora sp. NPDC127111 TaxID=3345363 RepID=UPI00362BBB97
MTVQDGRRGGRVKRFAKSVTGQFTIAAIASLAFFALVWGVGIWVVSVLAEGSPLEK